MSLNENHMTQKLVLAITPHGSASVVPPSICKPEYGYTAASEVLEVTFTPLPAEVVVASQLDALDKREEELRSELADKIAAINERRSELRALTHQVTE